MSALHSKMTPDLRDCAQTCAKRIGATLPGFAGEAPRHKYAAVENIQGQRERANKVAKARQ